MGLFRKKHAFTAPQIIPTGAAFPELCQLVADFTPDAAVGSDWIWSIKVDGIRALYIDGRIVSREGSPLDCCSHLLPGLQRMEADAGCPLFIDMEYAAEAGFDATDSERKRGVGTGIGWILDGFPLDQWMAGGSFDPIERRLGRLDGWGRAADSKHVQMLNRHVAKPLQLPPMANGAFLSNLEGIVAKRAGSIYRRERTTDWLKLKKQVEQVCPIIDILFKGNAFAGLMCKGPTGPIKITNGFSHHQKMAFMLLAQAGQSLDGAKAKLRWNEKAGSDKPRHAVFVDVA